MKRYEYKTWTLDTVNNQDFVNDKTLDGWELICVVPVCTYTFTYWFKREIENDK